MWYCYEGEWMNWHTLTTSQVHEIVAKNKAKEKVASIEEYASEHIIEEKVEFENVVGQDSLTRFDQPATKRKKRKKRRNNNRSGKPQQKGNSQQKDTTANKNNPNKKPAQANSAAKPRRNKRRNNRNRPPKKND